MSRSYVLTGIVATMANPGVEILAIRYSPDGTIIYDSRGGEHEGVGRC